MAEIVREAVAAYVVREPQGSPVRANSRARSPIRPAGWMTCSRKPGSARTTCRSHGRARRVLSAVERPARHRHPLRLLRSARRVACARPRTRGGRRARTRCSVANHSGGRLAAGPRLGGRSQATFYEGSSAAIIWSSTCPSPRTRRIAELLGIQRSRARLRRYRVATLAEVLGLKRIATTDRRHFDPLARALGLTLVP